MPFVQLFHFRNVDWLNVHSRMPDGRILTYRKTFSQSAVQSNLSFGRITTGRIPIGLIPNGRIAEWWLFEYRLDIDWSNADWMNGDLSNAVQLKRRSVEYAICPIVRFSERRLAKCSWSNAGWPKIDWLSTEAPFCRICHLVECRLAEFQLAKLRMAECWLSECRMPIGWIMFGQKLFSRNIFLSNMPFVRLFDYIGVHSPNVHGVVPVGQISINRKTFSRTPFSRICLLIEWRLVKFRMAECQFVEWWLDEWRFVKCYSVETSFIRIIHLSDCPIFRMPIGWQMPLSRISNDRNILAEAPFSRICHLVERWQVESRLAKFSMAECRLSKYRMPIRWI